MDVLSDILQVTRLGEAVLAQTELVAPWGVEVRALHKAAVHIVQRGECFLTMDGTSPLRLNTGDLILVAAGRAHALRDHPNTPAVPYEELHAVMKRPAAASPTSTSALVMCAEYEFDDEGLHPMLAQLPPVIHIPAAVARADPSLQSLVQLLAIEAAQKLTGSELVVPRLIDSLLVFIVRCWLAQQPKETRSWFSALRDPNIGRALSLIHERPEYPWTVEELATCVAQSRAAFARRFTQLLGEPPLSYVTRWRMSLATKLLKSTDETIERIALRVGYDSATAFGKAFRRALGTSPGVCRARAREERSNALASHQQQAPALSQ